MLEIGVRAIPFNLVMRNARREAGLTQGELAKMVGICQSALSAIERLCARVSERDATQIALALGYEVDYLFPFETRNFKTVNSRSVEFIHQIESLDALPEGHEALMLAGPEEVLEKQSLISAVQAALQGLSARDRIVLTLRFGFDGEKAHTLEEAGARLLMTRERVRQVEQKALQRLRHPARGLRELRQSHAI